MELRVDWDKFIFIMVITTVVNFIMMYFMEKDYTIGIMETSIGENGLRVLWKEWEHIVIQMVTNIKAIS